MRTQPCAKPNESEAARSRAKNEKTLRERRILLQGGCELTVLKLNKERSETGCVFVVAEEQKIFSKQRTHLTQDIQVIFCVVVLASDQQHQVACRPCCRKLVRKQQQKTDAREV